MTGELIPPQNTQVLRDEFGKWLPGAIPNPGGRPKSTLITDRLKEALASADAAGKSGAEKIGDRLIGLTEERDGYLALAAIKEVTDRTEGKAVQNTNVRGIIVMMPADAVLDAAFMGSEEE